MFHKHQHQIQFYGTGTIGEKGQIVIPARARKELKIAPGDNFIFFGHGPLMNIIKTNQIDGILDKMTQKFSEFKKEIKKKG